MPYERPCLVALLVTLSAGAAVDLEVMHVLSDGVRVQAIAGKVAVSLLSPSAFTFAADLIGQYEGSGVGLHWSDMWSDPLPLGAILFLLALDAKLYAGLAW